MICPICRKRKAKRYCPAKTEMICALCCGTEREVTIDCPSDCSYLIASRQYHNEGREVDWAKIPFAEQRVSPSVVSAHEDMYLRFSYAICSFARANPALVDSDVQAALQALAESYQTLAKGIVYENPPANRVQQELYKELQAEVEKQKGAEGPGLIAKVSSSDKDVRDILIFLTQLSVFRSNGRPKGRAFLDSLRAQFKPGTFAGQASPLIVSP